MLKQLPGWVKDDVSSVREEVAEWIGTSAAQRWRIALLCTRDAMWAARVSGRQQHILDYQDPLPESTIAALARLRRQAGW